MKNYILLLVFRALKTLKTLNDEGAVGMLPDELQPVLGAMKTLGYGAEIDKVTQQIGQVSKVALSESQGIMTDAIKEVSFGDAVSVVLGGEELAHGHTAFSCGELYDIQPHS